MLKRVSVESILVMFLFIIFTASIGLLIVEGQEAFSKVIDNKNANEDTRIALSYINMKVKQNNLFGNIEVVDSTYNDSKALLIQHYGEEADYITYIVYDDGKLYECYQDKGTKLDINFGEVIVEVKEKVSFQADRIHSLINVFYGDENLLSIEVYGMGEANEE